MQRRTSVEIQAYSVDEAIRLALEQLELSRDDVDIEVLVDTSDDPDDEALVRVTARGQASQPEPRAERQKQQRQQGGGDRLRGRRSRDDRPSRRGSIPRPAVAERVDAEDEAIAKQTVLDLLQHMGVEADVMAVDNPSSVPLSDEDPPTIFIDILGSDLGMLIGRRGEHLSHIQYLVNLMVNRKLETWSRVIIDVEGYRTRREESLVGLAERVARQVSRSGRPVTLEPMPPNERRVIHLTLRSHPDVGTESSGEGNERRITVLPRG
ncbi:MAG TPA: RNA-binding cell elongation regulator Jag/EloR [Thermomicrobiales bacterium]|nr:RNA-binding cell elongation regulator Jag/EloR [Thermomicrobiales bacterium]